MDITITMVQDEIMDAIKDFMVKHDVVTAGKEVDINLVAGRGPNGHSAVIAIKNSLTPSAIPTGPVPRAAVTPGPAVVPTSPVPAEVDPFAADLPADSKAALRAKKTASTKKDVTEEVDALFAQENSMTEDLEEEVPEEQEVLFGAE